MKRRELEPGTIFEYLSDKPTTRPRYIVDGPPNHPWAIQSTSTSAATSGDEEVIVIAHEDAKRDAWRDGPRHYKDLSPEPIRVIMDWGLNYTRSSAIKYLARAGRKEGADETSDIEKAIHMLRLDLAHLRSKK